MTGQSQCVDPRHVYISVHFVTHPLALFPLTEASTKGKQTIDVLQWCFVMPESEVLQKSIQCPLTNIVLQNLCFTKKIRYESRKQLAQARPRVKGQFVRVGDIADAVDALTEARKVWYSESQNACETFLKCWPTAWFQATQQSAVKTLNMPSLSSALFVLMVGILFFSMTAALKLLMAVHASKCHPMSGKARKIVRYCHNCFSSLHAGL